MNDEKTTKMTMTLKSNRDGNHIFIGVGGVGMITIDWGDGSPCGTHELPIWKDDDGHCESYEDNGESVYIVFKNYRHLYPNPGDNAYTVTITGDDITYLDCDDSRLTTLDVSVNTALKWLQCRCNQLTALDVSKNTALIYLDCSINKLTALDVSKNTVLRKLYYDKLRTKIHPIISFRQLRQRKK
jgi:hypothetical protein